MAQVTLQVVVERSQIDKLKKDIDNLNKRKITISTKEATANLKNAEKAFRELQKSEQEAQKTEQQREKTAQQQIRTERERIKLTREATRAQKDETSAQKEATQADKEFTEGFNVTAFMGRVLAYRMLYQSIQAVTTAFRDAINTIHKVDDELVTVRKVTGFGSAQMESIQRQAYATATKYGSAADEYLSSVSSFARAGYKDQSSALAELATKTQIVGDTTAEVAQQFLLSVDAGYKYKGSIEALSAVLDGANELDNKFATSIEKIAEGMGIVAPVAAQMHVGIDELAASIGTITAVTQRSGTEAARALRALFLNIVGDTKTEIEEGVTWTTGEIAGLQDVIKKYAKDAYDAAQATGSIIDPMRAMEGLARSMKDGVLTEQKLMEMVSDIGGKLRTSQLLAIIQNWDMYEEMLTAYKNAYGSADKEVENAMDSWTRKANVLKNTWTQFVEKSFSSEAVKNLFDGLTGIVERLDSIPGVLTRISMIVIALKLPNIVKTVKGLVTAIKGLSTGLTATSGILAGIAVVWGVVSLAIENAKIKHQEEVKAIYETADAAKSSSEKTLELYAAFKSATGGAGEFNSAGKELADTLGVKIPEGASAAIQKLQELTEKQLKTAAAAAYTASATAQDEFLSASRSAIGTSAGLNVEYTGVSNAYSSFSPELQRRIGGVLGGLSTGANGIINTDTLENARAFRQAMEDVLDVMNQYSLEMGDASLKNTVYYESVNKYLADTQEAYADLEKYEKEAFDSKAAADFAASLNNVSVTSKKAYNDLINTFTSSTEYTNEEKELLIQMANEYFPQFTNAVKDETDALDKNTDAMDQNATAAERLKAAQENAQNAARKFIAVLFDENGAITAVGKSALQTDSNLAALVQSELNSELAAKQANYSALVAQLAMVGITAETTAQQLWALARAESGGGPMSIISTMVSMGRNFTYQAILKSRLAEIKGLQSQISSVGAYVSSGSSGGRTSISGGRTSSGGSSGSTEDKKLEKLKDRIALLKSELSLMKERGDSEEDQIAKMREIQRALHAEADYLRSIKGDQASINDLSREWWSIENDITKEKETQAKALQDALDAQIALNNAMNDRSVRYYNAETGQWEWGANQDNVNSAREALQNAISAAGFSSMDAWNLYYASRQALNGIDTSGFPNSVGSLGSLGAGNPIPRGGVSNNYVGGTNNYGNTYQFGNFTFTEDQARRTTLFDLAQMSRNLALYSGTY